MLIGGEDEEFQDAERRDRMLTKKAKNPEKMFHKNFPNFTFREDFGWAGTFVLQKTDFLTSASTKISGILILY